jgi:hypothetical protein
METKDDLTAATLPDSIESATNVIAAVAAKYGTTRMARYLLRSFEDWFDVCETINRQVIERVERDDVEPLYHEIPCWAMAVPNTFSSVIIGLGIPSAILDENRTSTHTVRPYRIDFSASAQPAIRKTDRMIVLAHDVKSLFDLNAFNQYLRNPDGLKEHGLEIASIKRSIRMTVKKRDGIKANFALILTHNMDATG